MDVRKWKAKKLGDVLEGNLISTDFNVEYPDTAVLTVIDNYGNEKVFSSAHKLIREQLGELELNCKTQIKAIQPGPKKGFVYEICQKTLHTAPNQMDWYLWRHKAGYRSNWKPIDWTSIDLCDQGCPLGTYYTYARCMHAQQPKVWEAIIDQVRQFGGANIAVLILRGGNRIGLNIDLAALKTFPWTANEGQRVQITYSGLTPNYTQKRNFLVEFLGGSWTKALEQTREHDSENLLLYL